ncbi:MAG: acyl-CoA thioesterase [Bdellovibrionales bacterium]|nr:acyl-CoA thioesterase [Bdellovibrionales bacterium]
MTKLSPKSPQKSQVQSIEHVLPSDTNSHGTVFGGKVMQWIDIIGSICAMRHARKPVVTASFDRVDFYAPAGLGHILILNARVNYVGSTSMEIEVTVEAENPLTGERELTTDAFLTFVATNHNGRPSPVPPLKLETEEEKRRYEEGKARKEARMKNRKRKS